MNTDNAITADASTNVSPVAKTAKRVAYGFELNFPETFTMRDLRNLKSRKVKYITLYMRVKKALASGEIVREGTAANKGKRGRKQIVYRRADLAAAPAEVAAV